MRADNYPPINVLSVFRGVQSHKLKYHITPYRFEKQNGQAFKRIVIGKGSSFTT